MKEEETGPWTDVVERLRKELHENVIDIKFLKKNGEERAMKCTWNMDFIPKADQPAADTGEAKPKKEKNENLLVVYDVEKEGWRSFNADSLIEVTFPKETT